MKKNGVIILAAGSSSRLGRPKQTLTLNKQTLLHRMLNAATVLNCGPVIIVLGANAQLINQNYKDAHTVINENWQQGMGSSICCGLKKLLEIVPDAEGVFITVCDQPYVTHLLLQKILDTQQQSNLPIVASSYGDVVGTPALFHQTVFKELLQLAEDKGARQIINKHKNRVAVVDFPLGSVDVDTEEDYARLLQNEKND